MGAMKCSFALLSFLALAPLVPLAAAEAPHAVLSDTDLCRDFRKALDTIEKADSDDFFEAARIVVEKTGDPTLMLPLMEDAAAKGSAAAASWLALSRLQGLYSEGADMSRDARAKELRKLIFDAAARDYHPAMVQASRLAGMGIGGEADEKLALRYLMNASRQNSSQARAAYLLMSGRLAKGDWSAPEIASELKKENFYLEELIAQCYQDTPEGVAWMRRASNHGSATAPFLLTQSHSAGLGQEEAMSFLELAAERHQPEAMAMLGMLELHAEQAQASTGVQVKKDAEQGLRRLLISCALGSPTAAHTLALAYAMQQAGPVPVDFICRLFKQAAEHGEAEGMAGYGYCLLCGRGCPQDAARGEQMLLRASEKGVLWAKQALASAYFNGFGVKPDMQAALDALTEDAAVGSLHAYTIMAAIVALGNEGCPPNARRAAVYLDMARRKGEPEAEALYDSIIKAGGWKFMPGLWP